MDETVVRAVERAITTMRGSLSDKVTIDDLARSAMFSKFHFSRVFRKITGVSPADSCRRCASKRRSAYC
ncbi:helix-turn-helix transcriptional regulator [Actinokineospora soli]|uniref:Helix-turn-helix transcriptional regulator n=1 Tax=Actinokineospora soli TaxID=1048753 RepID=A0ABW2TSN8_9PSEU